MTRALAIIDGEHYASTVRDALAELPYDFVGAYLVGGTEKLRGGEEYGVPVVSSLEAGLELRPELVLDLSDEPVLSPPDRLLLASRVLAAGASYAGADFRFDPPEFEPFELPSLAVIGTGKRVGKTAVSAHILRTLRERHDVVAVAMGRGGPREPEVVDVRPTVDTLLERSRAGHHAASDYLELAALTGAVTVGCRRAGGGLAGAVGTSNVREGARVAAVARARARRLRRQRRRDPAGRRRRARARRRPRARRDLVPERVPRARLRPRRRDRARRRRADPPAQGACRWCRSSCASARSSR